MAGRREENPMRPRWTASYKHQRAFYDLTRTLYLLGRDPMVDEIDGREAGRARA